MLLKPVSSSLPAINSKFSSSSSSFSRKVNWLNKTQVQRRRRRIVVAVGGGGGYSKKSLDTPGAYELVDEETGDKYIIWGDDNDHDVPSKQLLQWEPPKHPSKGGASSKGVSRSFERLRVGKVRDLSRVSSSEKDQKDDNSRSGSVVKRQEETLLANKNRFNVIRDNDVSKSRAAELGGTSMNFSSKLRKSNATSDFYSRKSFKDVGCADYMFQFLNSQLLANPSHIQAMSFPHVINGKSCIIADQSGSGKTLAYLLPVIQCIRQDELQGIAKSLPESPRVVILVPTAELASQVLRNCRLMSKSGVPFRSMIATGGFKQKTQLESLRNELDVLIATPGRFLYLVEEGFLQLTNLKCAVLDEVDILFKDEDFQPALQSLMNLSPVTTQYLFVTATLPVDVYNKLVENFPDCESIMGPGMHRTSSGLEEILVDCSGEEGIEKTPDTAFQNKKSALLKLAEEGPITKMIIFCNKIETCRKVENALNRFNRKVLPFHAALSQDLRVANMEEFCQTRLKDNSLFLVCTDRASRGIDIPGVDQVVLFDFPRDPSEYVRRVGRTARGAGGKGRAFIFVVGKQVSLARRIIERNKKGHPLHDVPSEI